MITPINAAIPQTLPELPLDQDFVSIGYAPTVISFEPSPPPIIGAGARFARSAPEPAEDAPVIAVTYEHGCQDERVLAAQPAVAGQASGTVPAEQSYVYLSGKTRWPAIYAHESSRGGGAES